jgi:hypothetical protein
MRPEAVNALELAARGLWREWGGAWGRFTVCARCGGFVYCGAPRRSGPFVCLACFDVSAAATKALGRPYRDEARSDA